MQRIIDKLVLLGLCLLAVSFTGTGWLPVVAMLAALTVSALCEYFENKLPVFLCAGYAALCFAFPVFTLFLPLVAYDFSGLNNRFLRYGWIAALPAGVFIGVPQLTMAAALSCGVAFLLQYRTAAQLKTREDTFRLEDKNRELMEKQDYEIRLATLTERNRIAREIHDNVGHLLTRSLLQIGALRVERPEDDGLEPVRDTLSEAMDSIRSSVHGLHGESVDLRSRLEALAGGFAFCPVTLRYDAGELPAGIKYCFDAVVREALSNIARHSNATEASVAVTEHPAFCKLVIADNGSAGPPRRAAAGIGLQNMSDRVEALDGIFRAGYDRGFRIFITVPKGEKP